jgi:hypothetical protein
MNAFGSVRKDWKWTPRPLSQDALSGDKVAVIGGTNGIGRALTHALAAKGAEVLVVGRTFRDHGLPRVNFIQADLSTMKEARKIARELPAETLDMLIMTQGIFAGSERKASAEGIELDMAVSALSRFVLVRELADRLGKNRSEGKPKPRVFVWGFPGKDRKATIDDFNSESRYVWRTAHINGVVVNEALVLDSAERYPTLNFYGMNPGFISSNIMAGVLGEGTFKLKAQQTIIGLLFQSAEKYAGKVLPLLVSPDIEHHSGAMFNRHGYPIHSNPSLLQKPYLQQVMEESEKLAKKALL